MKTRIPPDVERLMWLAVESNDPNAIHDFEVRFPHLQQEFAVRRRMVSQLKGAKQPAHSERPIPQFTLRNPAPSGPKKGTLIAGGLAFAALAVASYSITQWVIQPIPRPKPPVPVQTTPVKEGGEVSYVPTIEQRTKPNEPATTNQPEPDTSAPTVSQTDLPKDLKISNSPLTAALKLIGQKAGYQVTIAPGFEDQTVSIDYRQMTTAQMLKDLGQQYAFTAFDQGDGTIIIVPAVDGGPPATDISVPQRHLGG